MAVVFKFVQRATVSAVVDAQPKKMGKDVIQAQMRAAVALRTALTTAAKVPRLSREQEQSAIADFLSKKQPTKCPTVFLVPVAGA